MGAVPKEEKRRRIKANEEKWSPNLVDAGWTLVPSIILEQQQALGLDPLDVNVLLQIARHWWIPGQPPYPSIATIAECVGRSVDTVQRRITSLKERGIIEVEHRFNKYGGQTSSAYSFDGLIEKATPYAIDRIEEKREKAAAKKRKSSWSKRGLSVVGD